MRKCCKERVEKKCSMHVVVDLEEVDSSDTTNSNVAVANEGSMTISNEQRSLEGFKRTDATTLW